MQQKLLKSRSAPENDETPASPQVRKKAKTEKELKGEQAIKRAAELRTSRELIDDLERVYQDTKGTIQYKNPFSKLRAREGEQKFA